MYQLCHILTRIYGCKFTTFFGASNRGRTCNRLFTKQMLFRLSYRGVELGGGLEPPNVGFADRYVRRFAIRAFAGAERFELPSTVLETAVLPLHHASVSRKV